MDVKNMNMKGKFHLIRSTWSLIHTIYKLRKLISVHYMLCIESMKFYTVPSIGASYQISINLAKCFREFFLKLANYNQELPTTSILVIISAWNMEIMYTIPAK